MKKFYLSLLGSALLSIIILGWLIDAFSQRTTHGEDQFSAQVSLLQGFSQQLSHIPADSRGAHVQQLAADFSVKLSYRDNKTLALPATLMAQISEKGLLLEDQQGFYLLYSTPALNPYHLELRLNKQTIVKEHNDITLTLLFYTGLCVIMGLIITPLAKRLSVLNDAAKRFAQGNLTTRIPPSQITYIKDVELTFNRMASQIEKLLAENKLMASSLSHDIRTPIACLRFGLDAAMDCKDDNKRAEYLTRMESDLSQMESMLKSYLDFATLEQKANRLTYESTEMSDYLIGITQQLTPKLNDKHIRLSTQFQSGHISADLHWLARAIINLISNACDFAHQQIHISAEFSGHNVIIRIEDDGPGVAKAHWQQIFEPFYQSQSHRNRGKENYGLGLAIVAKVADWHHGSVRVCDSKKLGGACFVLTIHK